jgi:sugar transferase (PEP-CTERM/EpsH1 system associated)
VRILFLSQRVPYPPNRGDKITTYRLVERLGRRFQVEILAFAEEPEDQQHAAALNRQGLRTHLVARPQGARRLASLGAALLAGRALTLGHYSSPALHAKAHELAAGAGLCYAYSSSMGAFLLPLHGQRRIMHFAELDSDKWQQYAQRSKGLRWPMGRVYAREARTLLRFEKQLAQEFDHSVFCTPLEQSIFERVIPGCPSTVIRNGVDLSAQTALDPKLREPDHLVFVGVMDYLPNSDGVSWFAREILPLVRAERPGARFTIVGARPTPAVLALGQLPGVQVTGFVDDPRAWLARASVSVAPLRIARGIQNKVLEAMAAALPVLGTTSATQGVEGQAGRDFLVADTASEFARQLLQLLAQPEAARQLGLRGRAFVEQHYGWEQVLAPFDRLIDQTLASPSV